MFLHGYRERTVRDVQAFDQSLCILGKPIVRLNVERFPLMLCQVQIVGIGNSRE